LQLRRGEKSQSGDLKFVWSFFVAVHIRELISRIKDRDMDSLLLQERIKV
jgi:hypothetical protein